MGARAEKEQSTHVPPHPHPTPLPQSQAQARLGTEAGEGVQARLTAHWQGGRFTGRDVVGHVALAHEGANAKLLRGLLRPPKAGAGQGEEGLYHCWVELAAMPGPLPTPTPLLLDSFLPSETSWRPASSGWPH